MPVLKDFRLTKTLSLPSLEGGEIVIYNSLLVGDMLNPELSEGITAGATLAQSMKALPFLIKSWNLTNEEGEVLPITLENIGLIPAEDVAYVFTEIESFVTATKKK